MSLVVHYQPDLLHDRGGLAKYVKQLLGSEDQNIFSTGCLGAEQLGEALDKVQLHDIRELVDTNVITSEGLSEGSAYFVAKRTEGRYHHRKLRTVPQKRAAKYEFDRPCFTRTRRHLD